MGCKYPSGDGWRFAGNPGFEASSNGRTAGTYTWIDFSGTDVGCVLEVEDVDVSGLTTPSLVFDYFSDYGIYSTNGYANNEMNVEAWDGTTWNNLMTITGVDSLGAWTLGPVSYTHLTLPTIYSV